MFSSYLEIFQSNWMATATLFAGLGIGYASSLLKRKQRLTFAEKQNSTEWIEQFLEPAIILDNHSNVIESNNAFRKRVSTASANLDATTLFPGFHYRQNKLMQGPAQLIETHDEAWLILTDALDEGKCLIRLIPTSHVSTQELIEQSSTDQLQILREILTNLAHAIEQPLLNTIDAAKKIETINNIQLPRTQYLINTLNLNSEALETYFERYAFKQSLNQLLGAIDDIKGLANEIKPQSKESLLTRKTFSFKEAFNDAAIKINTTTAASTLIEHGIQPVIYMDELDQDLHFIGSKQTFVDSIIAIYDLITQPFDHKINDGLPNVPSLSCNISLNHKTEQLIIKFYEISTQNWLAAYRKQYAPDMLTKSCQITLRGIIGLIKLHSSFQMTYSTEYLTPSTSTLKLSFPTNNALNKQYEPRNSRRFGSMRNNPENHELLESLSEDIESAPKNKKNITIH